MSDIKVTTKNALVFNENFKIKNFNDVEFRIVKY